MKPHLAVSAAFLVVASWPGLAADGHHPDNFVVEQTLDLKDGGTLFIYQDGKMAVEDKYGNPAVKVKPGAVVQTKKGVIITIKSNEIQRLQRSHSERGS